MNKWNGHPVYPSVFQTVIGDSENQGSAFSQIFIRIKVTLVKHFSSFYHLSIPLPQEISLHWAERPDTPNLSHEEYSALARNTTNAPKFSFDVPAVARPITLN